MAKIRLSEHAKVTVRNATERVNLWSGPVGSSKTQTSTFALLRHLDGEAPPGPVIILGHSQDSVQQNVVPALRSWLGSDRMGVKKNRIDMLGRHCYVFGGSNEASQAAYAGMSAAGGYVDEGSLLVKSAWEMFISRLRIPGKPHAFGTTNPTAPRHWLPKEWIGPGKLAHFVMTPADNLGLDPAQWEYMKSSYTGAFYRRMILGEWVAAEGAIYPLTMDRVWHGALPTIVRWYVGLDYGTTNPFAALLIGEGADKRAYVVDELYHDSTEDGPRAPSQYAEMVQAWLARCDERWAGAGAPVRFVVDPSANAFVFELRRAGISAVGGDNSVLDGIRWVSTLMAMDRLRFLPHCTHTIDEHSGYLWDDKAAEKGIDAPLKVDDHTPDADRYICLDRYGVWRPWVTPALRAA